MRRTDRERDVEFALSVIKSCEYATLGTVDADGFPYCVVISPVLIDKIIYFHGAKEGKKVTNIVNNPSVCLSCVGHTKLLPQQYTTEYESATVFGKCTVVTDDDEKIMALKQLTIKYAESAVEQFEKRIAGGLHKTGVFKIEIESITGKSNGTK